MFIDKTLERNRKLIETSFALHKKGVIMPDSYIVDMDMLLQNAKAILHEAKQQDIDLYFMLKQIGRNPLIAKKLVELGYKGAVVVDFKEATVMMKHQVPICNVGHLVQVPLHMIQKLVDYGCEYFTVFSIEKMKQIDACAKKSNKVQKVLLKVVGKNDMLYSGQMAGFELEQLEQVVHEVSTFENIEICGVTAFPCFLYDETKKTVVPTSNVNTMHEAKEILMNQGIRIENINAPSATSVFTIRQMKNYGINSGEPGHGLTGTTPLHAEKDCEEVPCVTYVSEISHNFRGRSYCYGGGYYRRSHVRTALVGKDLDSCQRVAVQPPNMDSIDYYFELDREQCIHDPVIMAFRFQIFVTRSNVVLVEGIQTNQPNIIGVYSSLGDEIL